MRKWLSWTRHLHLRCHRLCPNPFLYSTRKGAIDEGALNCKLSTLLSCNYLKVLCKSSLSPPPPSLLSHNINQYINVFLVHYFNNNYFITVSILHILKEYLQVLFYSIFPRNVNNAPSCRESLPTLILNFNFEHLHILYSPVFRLPMTPEFWHQDRYVIPGSRK